MSIGNAFKSTGVWVILAFMFAGGLAWQSFDHYQTNNKLIQSEQAYIGAKQLLDLESQAVMDANKEKNILQGKVKQLEAVEARSKGDIKDYILTYYKTVAPVIADTIATSIIEESEEHNVPFVVMVAMAEAESRFNPFAVSQLKKDPARGVMQVRYEKHAKDLGLTNKYQLHDIPINIDSGAKILRKLLDKSKGSMKQALWGYVGVVKNRSAGNAYVKRVYENMGRFTVFRSMANQKPSEEEDKLAAQGNPAETVEVGIKAKPVDSKLFGGHVSTKAQSINLGRSTETFFKHKVTHKGEELGLIAKWYTGKVSNWKKILELNPGLIPEQMHIGDEILIDPAWLERSDQMTLEYVRKGGTLDG